MEKRPSMLMLAGLWGGVLLGAFAHGFVPLLAMLAGAAAGALTLLAGPRRRVLVMTACLLLLGMLRSPPAVLPRGGDLARVPVVLRLRLPSLTGQCSEHLRGEVEDVLVGDTRLRGRRVIARGIDPGRLRGQRTMLVSGTYHPPGPPRNPMAYDYGAKAMREGMAGTVSVAEILEETCSAPDRAVAYLRRSVSRLISGVPETGARGVLEAVLLGSRQDLEPAVRSVMLKAGTYHVLAISGLHVGILVIMISILVTVLRLKRAARIPVSLLLVCFYVLFTGVRPSAMRAGAFFLVLSTARLFQFRTDMPNCLCLAAGALLAFAPWLAWDLGFRLSFGAVLGMTLLLPQVSAPLPRAPAALRFLRAVESGLLAAFTAQVFTLPVILWSFGRVSALACVSNLVLLPLMSLALASGLEAAVLALPLPRLGAVFMRAASVLTMLAVRLAGLLTSCFDPMVVAGRPHLWRVLAYYAVVLYAGFSGPRLPRRARLALLGAAFALMLVRLPGTSGAGGAVEFAFLDVGNGDACVIGMPGGKAVLVDTGPVTAEYDATSSVVLPYLALRGIGSLEKLVITHPHNDHYGGIPAMLDAVSVGEIVVSTTEGEEEYLAALDTAARAGVPVRCARAGETWRIGEALFEVLHPGGPGGPGLNLDRVPGEREDPNAWSLVLKVTYGGRSVLMTGDLTPGVQDSLVTIGAPLGCDVLKVPHHGHPGETSTRFLESLGAAVAVISCGTRYFARPDTATMAMLEAAGLRVFSTRISGAVTVRIQGGEVFVRSVIGATRDAVNGVPAGVYPDIPERRS